MLKITRRELESRYGDEEKIGIRNECPNTGKILRDEDIGDDTDCISVLPNGEQFFICTNSAKFVVDDLKQGDVYGFANEDNPVTHSEISSSDGHDFAVVRGRFIVDLWISHFTGCETQVVYDLKDPKDAAKIKEIYGAPEKWSVMMPEVGFVKPSEPTYPSNKRLQAWAEHSLSLG
jgi:hypothetical protein